jgi:hypothetical protein
MLMTKHNKRVTSVSAEYMRDKLRDWKPEWKSQTIQAFSFSQLLAVYLRVQREVLLEVLQTHN